MFEKKKTAKEGKLIEYFGKEGVCVQIEETPSLNAWVINDGLKGGDESAIQKRMK